MTSQTGTMGNSITCEPCEIHASLCETPFNQSTTQMTSRHERVGHLCCATMGYCTRGMLILYMPKKITSIGISSNT